MNLANATIFSKQLINVTQLQSTRLFGNNKWSATIDRTYMLKLVVNSFLTSDPIWPSIDFLKFWITNANAAIKHILTVPDGLATNDVSTIVWQQ